MRKVVCYSLLGIAVLTFGCASGTNQDISSGQFGNHSDSSRWEAVSLSLLAQEDLVTLTIPQVKKALRYPRAVREVNRPTFKADYDKARGVTEVSVFGNGISVSPYAGEVTQGYWAEWEIRAKIGPDSRPALDEWNLVGSVQTLDQKFPGVQE
jgi:hypothetical protein